MHGVNLCMKLAAVPGTVHSASSLATKCPACWAAEGSSLCLERPQGEKVRVSWSVCRTMPHASFPHFFRCAWAELRQPQNRSGLERPKQSRV